MTTQQLTLLLQQTINGLVIGGVYAIFALGYTLVFSILRIINFAHGAIFTVGAYLTFTLMGGKFGFNGVFAGAQFPIALPFVVAAIGGSILAGLIGVVVERLAFRPLRAKGADPLLTLVSSLGIALALVTFIQYLVGAENISYPGNVLGDLPKAIILGSAPTLIPIRTTQLIIFGMSLVIVVLLTILVNYTKVGKALRAVSEDAVTASLLGISSDQLILFTFFLSGFIGGIAGTLVGLSVSINGPTFGIAFGLKGLAVIVLGGLGDIPGAVLGGFVIGIAEAVLPALMEIVLPAAQYLPSGVQWIGYKDAIAFVLLFIILLVRPQGLLGRAVVQKV